MMGRKPYRLAVRAVICDEQGRCLLVRRSGKSRHFAGQWEWPGGKVDEGEGFEEALRREVREETGLEVELGEVVGAYGLEVEAVRVAVLCLEARVTAGQVVLSDEHDREMWVAFRELGGCDLVESLWPLAADLAASGPRGEKGADGHGC